VIQELLKNEGMDALSEQDLGAVYLKVYTDLIASVDGNDNGIYQYESSDKIIYNYKVKTDLPARVGRLNPRWNEENVTDIIRDQQFAKAVAITGEEFRDHVLHTVLSWLPVRNLIAHAFAKRFSYQPNGKIIVLEQYFPWTDQLLELEQELEININEKPLFVVFPDSTGSWRVQAIPIDEYQRFSTRRGLPEAWRGVRDDALSKLSGIEGCIFVRKSSFDMRLVV
jgi:uncharacterized UPF0160 family protein